MARIITTLQHRRDIEATLEALAQARTEQESQQALRTLAGYGEEVLPILTLYLDTPDPWMVRALGRAVVQIADRRRAVEALRRAVLDPHSSDRRRIVAIVLLDQFLEEPPDEALLSALGDPTEVALRALTRETIPEDRLSLLDYLSILHAQPLAELLYALERLREAGNGPAVEALTFMALDGRDAVARPAIEALGTIRRPESLQALQVIAINAPASRRSLVERMQQKLFLSGIRQAPLPPLPEGIRVLVSPPDGQGNRLLLILFPQGRKARGVHIFLDEESGIENAYQATLQADEVPPMVGRGHLVPGPHPWEDIFLLESGFSYLHRLLRQALDLNELRGGHLPLEYRFFCTDLWGWAVPPEAMPVLPKVRPTLSEQEVSALLRLPVLPPWFLAEEEIEEAARRLVHSDLRRPAGEGVLALVTVSLAETVFTAVTRMHYSRRLRALAEWLVLAGQKGSAQTAVTIAAELEQSSPLRSLFALMLVQQSLLFAIERLRLQATRSP